jgi:hypothetical protein|tara:strand:+ start:2440 stop:2622 length:183 start_codon:yes stop_codon:yes gene_type:complete
MSKSKRITPEFFQASILDVVHVKESGQSIVVHDEAFLRFFDDRVEIASSSDIPSWIREMY